ncbi:MAG: hypothetical protein LBR77_08590 [Lachnospiraceae bacterium]|nr:hypothetical protein [Lachnospiraceae bacterium]
MKRERWLRVYTRYVCSPLFKWGGLFYLRDGAPRDTKGTAVAETAVAETVVAETAVAETAVAEAAVAEAACIRTKEMAHGETC